DVWRAPGLGAARSPTPRSLNATKRAPSIPAFLSLAPAGCSTLTRDGWRRTPAGTRGRGDTEWRITTRPLATELDTGRLQLGDFTFEHREPADIPVAGDGRCSL